MDLGDSDISNSDLDSGSDVEENNQEAAQDWGPSKRNYYYTDYVDQDYPTKLDDKKAKLAEEEEVEALKIQKRLLSTIDYDSIINDQVIADENATRGSLVDLLSLIQEKNSKRNTKRENATNPIRETTTDIQQEPKKKVKFTDKEEGEKEEESAGVDRLPKRPINKAMEKNRGLTPYRKKAYRNPRVRHRNKFKKAVIKRRSLVQEAQKEWTRYSGELTGIKTSTVRSIKFS